VLYADAWRGGLDDGELVAWCDALARMHEIAIGNHRRDAAESERSRLVGELDLARAAQELMLPERSGRHGPYTWAVSARPGLEVAGDLVDIACMADDAIGLLVGDVAGKGARAGLVMASIQAYAHAIRERGEGPNDLLEALDQWAEEVVPEDVFITLWCARLAADGTIRFIDAGHGMTYVVTSEGAVDRVAGPHRPPVGTGAITVDPSDLALDPGCTLVLMSDGLPEQPNNDGDRFGEARLEDLLRTTTDPEALVDAVRSWSGRDSFEDDITVVAITFDPAPSK
jgi:serine phosphatase RsbU (regulator of sigma subunit)